MYTLHNKTVFEKGDQLHTKPITHPAQKAAQKSSRWPGMMSIATLAEYIDVSVSTASNLVRTGQLPPPTIAPTPRLKRWSREDIDQYLHRSSDHIASGPSIDELLGVASTKSRGGY
ncbi:helix-turn-helix domain-containing protein [Shimia sp. R10_1]|uniref:helix-turn-helix transcriptional regulator n=1 Tax=Shimia sp. R10_1 TaxID=2821095 RepID=UPI001ADA02FC|nr:helix-turn-helix domain-containing protein [Shimia sp. R10_1]MBO9474015.1 helix-turn-helix domain-containing protein [Shimia sp. R10_1]